MKMKTVKTTVANQCSSVHQMSIFLLLVNNDIPVKCCINNKYPLSLKGYIFRRYIRCNTVKVFTSL